MLQSSSSSSIPILLLLLLLLLLRPPPSSATRARFRNCMCFPLVCSRLYSACTRLYRLGCRSPWVFVLRLYSFVFRLYSFVPPGMPFPLSFCTPSVLVCTRLYSVCIRLYRLGCCFPRVFVFRLYSFVLSPRLANIILLGDGRSTKVQKCANVIQALYWVPVGQTGSLRHAPLPRHRCARQAKERGRACVRACVFVCAFTKAFVFFIFPHYQRRGSNTETDLKSDAVSKSKGGQATKLS